MFRYEFGHRYSAHRHYRVPVDRVDITRMRHVHELFRNVNRLGMGDNENDLTRAPIDGSWSHVLDVGTEFGSWALSFGLAYPDILVKGVDTCPIQTRVRPPNVSFEMFDVDEGILGVKEEFDLVHFQDMDGCLARTSRVMDRAFEYVAYSSCSRSD